MATLITYGGTALANGDAAELDSNYPVTVTKITPPCDDFDTGSVTIRHSYGATEEVAPVRLGAYISLD